MRNTIDFGGEEPESPVWLRFSDEGEIDMDARDQVFARKLTLIK